MDNQPLLQAMKAMIEPIQKDIADIKEHTTRIEERATRTKTLIENDSTKKLSLLGEGQLGMNEKFRQLGKLTNKAEDIQTNVEVLILIFVRKKIFAKPHISKLLLNFLYIS